MKKHRTFIAIVRIHGLCVLEYEAEYLGDLLSKIEAGIEWEDFNPQTIIGIEIKHKQ